MSSAFRLMEHPAIQREQAAYTYNAMFRVLSLSASRMPTTPRAGEEGPGQTTRHWGSRPSPNWTLMH